jgi:hypothetical protein
MSRTAKPKPILLVWKLKCFPMRGKTESREGGRSSDMGSCHFFYQTMGHKYQNQSFTVMI